MYKCTLLQYISADVDLGDRKSTRIFFELNKGVTITPQAWTSTTKTSDYLLILYSTDSKRNMHYE